MCNRKKNNDPRTELCGIPRLLFLVDKEVTINIYKLLAVNQVRVRLSQ